MALHDPDLQYQAALDRKTRENAHLFLTALKAGSKISTAAMIEDLGAVLGDDQALADLIQRTARGENAFLTLLQQLALDAGEKAARDELADAPRRRCEQARLDQFAPIPI